MVEIITNNVPRLVLDFHELSKKQQEEFSYTHEEGDFFYYKGELYTTEDFAVINYPDSKTFEGWHGILSQTFFSGILIKYIEDDRILVGRYYAS